MMGEVGLVLFNVSYSRSYESAYSYSSVGGGSALIDSPAKETYLLIAAGGRHVDHGHQHGFWGQHRSHMSFMRLDPTNEPFFLIFCCGSFRVIVSYPVCPRLDPCEIQAAVYQVDLGTTLMFWPLAVLPPQQASSVRLAGSWSGKGSSSM